jgi:hypothetical protein
MTIKITTPNGGSDSLDFGCAQTPNVAAVTGTEVSSGEGKLELKTTTGGTSATKATVLANGNVGIGTTAPEANLHIIGNASGLNDGTIALFEGNNNGGNRGIHIGQEGSGSQGWPFIQSYHSQAVTNYWELLLNPYGGNVGIGTTDPASILHLHAADPTLTIQDTNDTGDAYIKFKNNTGTVRGFIQTAMTADVMIFGSGTTERMRMNSAGNLVVGTTDDTPWNNAADGTADNGIAIRDGGLIAAARYQSNPLALNRTGNNGTIVGFYRSGTTKGTISITTSAVAYNTTSDYRLKENVEYDWDATTRLKQLKPARFNFKINPDDTVDGFLAHEAQEVVPEAVTGVKDEVDDDDKPVMQGIDQSKLVPLLVKTIQELEARIAKLEEDK